MCKRLEDLLDRYALDNLNMIKNLFQELKFESIETVNMQLAKFREVKQMGMLSYIK